MGIDVRWTDADQKDLGVVVDSGNLLSRHVGASEWPNTICLRFVDPYGDTVFNQHQIPIVQQELEASLPLAPDSNVGEHIARVVELLRRAAGQVHTYMWFIGD